MKSGTNKEIITAYRKKFGSDADSNDHLKQMLSYRFLSEIEKITDARNLSRKELALMLGVSASYITQLYRGSKVINMDMLVRLEQALNIRFDITAIMSEPKEQQYVQQTKPLPIAASARTMLRQKSATMKKLANSRKGKTIKV